MLLITAEQIRENLDWTETITALEQMFGGNCVAPPRHHHTIGLKGQQDATMLLMPAWVPGSYNGLKLVNVYPGNSQKGIETILGTYILMQGETGEVLAIMDAGELTARRTVCASALASKFLSRPEAEHLLIVGSGRLAKYLGFAHGAVRSLKHIHIWARNRQKAHIVAELYLQSGFEASVVEDLESGCSQADIISCATMAHEPLITGNWLRPGTHVDLIGGFKPTMREVDSEAVSRSTVFVDTRIGALSEAGDLLIPIEQGVITQESIAAELSELVSLHHPGRTDEWEITLFKSVGASIEDLAAAISCYEHMSKRWD